MYIYVIYGELHWGFIRLTYTGRGWGVPQWVSAHCEPTNLTAALSARDWKLQSETDQWRKFSPKLRAQKLPAGLQEWLRSRWWKQQWIRWFRKNEARMLRLPNSFPLFILVDPQQPHPGWSIPSSAAAPHVSCLWKWPHKLNQKCTLLVS